MVEPTVNHPIHPIHKQPVGERMALSALGRLYGRDVAYLAPTLRDTRTEGDAIYVCFDHVGKGLELIRGNALRGFELCGEDGVFVPARAEIIAGDTVRVTSEFIPKPYAVNYAFYAMNGTANLCNSSGIPAVPFRGGKPSDKLCYNRDWACCDTETVWVDAGYYHTQPIDGYRLHINEYLTRPMVRQGSEVQSAWEISPLLGTSQAAFAVDTGFKSEGDASIRLTYTVDGEDKAVGIGPVLVHESQNNDFSNFRLMAFDLANGDNRPKRLSLIARTWDDQTHTVPFVGADLLLPGDGDFHTFSVDLRAACTQPERFLKTLRHLQLTIEDAGTGSIWLDNFRFSPYTGV